MSDTENKKTLSLKKSSTDESDPKNTSTRNNRPLRSTNKAALRDRTKVPSEYRTKRENTQQQSDTENTYKPRNHTNNNQSFEKPKTDFKKRSPSQPHSQYRQAPTRGGKVRDGYDPEYKKTQNKPNTRDTASANPRLSKVMADRGLCSRREADAWIENGWVTVDGKIIDVLGTRVSRDAEVTVSKSAKDVQAESATFILHKPIGYVSGQPEDGYEPAVALITAENEWQEQGNAQLPDTLKKHFRKHYLKGLAPAGRLDIDSTGLLVLTQDGRIARKLIGEHSSVEKEYLVRVEGQMIENGMQLLNHGLSLDGQPLKRAKVSWQNEDQLRVVLNEGKKRQIRRMCELVGLQVVGLKRIRIGQIPLSKLPVGEWRFLGTKERF